MTMLLQWVLYEGELYLNGPELIAGLEEAGLDEAAWELRRVLALVEAEQPRKEGA